MSRPPPQPAKQPANPTMEKSKELWYYKALTKDQSKGLSQLFRFDLLNSLENIPAYIILYDLLRLFEATQDAVREAYTDPEVSIAQIP